MASLTVSDLWARVVEYFSQPYSLQRFIEDHKPQSLADIEYLEKIWYHQTDPRTW
jgi:hypothetical protein